uniref:peptidylprolyl isomerase n=1 Tax=Plectus sambesii TaxID=2011161 RepID=A0A914X5S0_9BILA
MWADITEEQDGGIFKGIKREGKGPYTPRRYGKKGDTIYVHYEAQIRKTKKTFHSTRKIGKEFGFTLGVAQMTMKDEDRRQSTDGILPFWGLALPTMKKGERAVFVVKSKYAYGPDGLTMKNEIIVPPNSTIIFDVELLRWEGEDVTNKMDKSILRSLIEAGDQYGKVNLDGRVTASITGYHNDRQFINDQFKFTCGDAELLELPKGIDEVVQQMTKNQRAWIQMDSKWCYGSAKMDKFGIPRFASLDFDIKIIDFERAPEIATMEKCERLEYAEEMRVKGKEWFQRGDFKQALQRFTRMWEAVSDTKEMRHLDGVSISMGGADWRWCSHTNRELLWQAAHLNLALCYMRMDEIKFALDHLDRCLAEYPRNEKALYRKGQCYLLQKEFKSAVECFRSVLVIHPECNLAKRQIGRIKQLEDEYKQQRLASFGRFFKD